MQAGGALGAEPRDPFGDGLRRRVERARRSCFRRAALHHAARHRLSTSGRKGGILVRVHSASPRITEVWRHQRSRLKPNGQPPERPHLGAADILFAKVNPRQARRFAEAIGSLAKTDRLDAAMLARMGAILELKTRPPRNDALLALKELHLAREALVKDRTAAKNRSKVLTASLLKRQNAQRFEQIDRQMAAIEAAILEQIRADPDLVQRFAILTSIPGVAAVTAFALLIEMPELGTLEAGQAASLAGLAPVARQSGRWTGRAFIRGSRAAVRQAVYMPALVAARFNPDMK